MNSTLKRILPKFALFFAAMIFGSSFFIVKNTVDIFPTNFLLAIRFTIGCLLLCALFPRKLRQMDRACLWQGTVLGLLIFAGYCIQTIGLTDTTPGKNAFLTASYCILVPFLHWVVDKRRPDLYNFSAAFLCLTGIGLVSFDGSFSMRFGDAMTLVSALFFAAHIVAGARFGGKSDPILLTIVQFGVAAVCAWILGFATETFPKEIPLNAVLGLLYLAVFATTLALLLQNVGLKYADPTSGAILLSLESVFGVLFSMIFYHEQLNFRLTAGFLLIFVAVILSETKLSFLRKKRS